MKIHKITEARKPKIGSFVIGSLRPPTATRRSPVTESRAQRCQHTMAEISANTDGICPMCATRHYADLEAENTRLRGAIETLVVDEVISAGRARELHGMSPEEQRKFWVDRYEQSLQDVKAIQDPDRAMEEAEDRKMRERDFAPPEEEPSE